MEKAFESLIKGRLQLIAYIQDLSTEQLNQIPNRFNNNIVWNLAHLISVTQAICYKRAGLPTTIEEEILTNYFPGTTPQPFVNTKQIEHFKLVLTDVVKELKKDYEAGLFNNNPSWTTRSGIELNKIEDSIHFLLWHDGLHFGVIMALKKLVG
jgi:hypothetical protein